MALLTIDAGFSSYGEASDLEMPCKSDIVFTFTTNHEVTWAYYSDAFKPVDGSSKPVQADAIKYSITSDAEPELQLPTSDPSPFIARIYDPRSFLKFCHESKPWMMWIVAVEIAIKPDVEDEATAEASQMPWWWIEVLALLSEISRSKIHKTRGLRWLQVDWLCDDNVRCSLGKNVALIQAVSRIKLKKGTGHVRVGGMYPKQWLAFLRENMNAQKVTTFFEDKHRTGRDYEKKLALFQHLTKSIDPSVGMRDGSSVPPIDGLKVPSLEKEKSVEASAEDHSKKAIIAYQSADSGEHSNNTCAHRKPTRTIEQKKSLDASHNFDREPIAAANSLAENRSEAFKLSQKPKSECNQAQNGSASPMATLEDSVCITDEASLAGRDKREGPKIAILDAIAEAAIPRKPRRRGALQSYGFI